MLEVEHIWPGVRPVPIAVPGSLPEGKQSGLFRIHTHPFAVAAKRFIFDNAVNLGKQGIVPAAAYIFSSVDPGTELADEYIAGPDVLTAEPLDASPLSLAVAAVPGTAACLFMCHGLASRSSFTLKCPR
jgi:hypothetical protein